MKGTIYLSHTGVPIASSDLRSRVSSLICQLNHDLLEREEAVRLCVLCAIANESIFLLGPPGVAKSLIARRIKQMFAGDPKSFEYLMNRFSTPDEIFGPVSIKGLREDRLVRKTESYLPKAIVVFLDEIWKAGPSIQNALLTAINERIFRNGGVDEHIDMRILISASNELPAEDQGLEALWDRFLVRLEVENISLPQNRHRLIRGRTDMEQLRILEKERLRPDELGQLDTAIDAVVIPDDVLGIIDDIIARINNLNEEEATKATDSAEPWPRIYVSDRRWKKIGRLLRASALCNGRTAVDELDCYLISYCIWDDVKHIDKVRRLVFRAIEQSLGPNAGVASFKREWQLLKNSVSSLPTTLQHKPTPFRGHYKIDLSDNAELLTDEDAGSFAELPKDSYELLDDQFKSIWLTQTKGTDTAQVLAKMGQSPIEVVLKKENAGPPLGPFPETVFRLNHSLSKQPAKVLDLSNDNARTFLIGLRDLQTRIASRIDNETGAADQNTQHLFVKLPADVAERFMGALDNAAKQNKLLLSEIEAFMKQQGLQ